MRTAGGIIGIIAGLFGIVAAGATLLMGGLGSATGADGANTVIGLGWGGVTFSFLVIIFGALALATQGRTPGVLLLVSAIGGILLGGTLVAIFMVMATAGGILASMRPQLGANAASPYAPMPGVVPPSLATVATPVVAARRSSRAWWVVGAGVVLILIGTLGQGGTRQKGPAPAAATAVPVSEPDRAPVRVGDTFTTPTFQIQVRSAHTARAVGSTFFDSTASDGAVYVTVQWSYRNISSKPVNAFRHPTLRLLAPDGTRYDEDLGATAAYASEQELDAKVVSDLNPGVRVSDAAVFEVGEALFDRNTWRILVDADVDTVVEFAPAAKAASPRAENEIPAAFQGRWAHGDQCSVFSDLGVPPAPGADISAAAIMRYEYYCKLVSVVRVDNRGFEGSFDCSQEGEQQRTSVSLALSEIGGLSIDHAPAMPRCL